MPGVDWLPGVSHIKASLQAITGDTEGAKRTIENFHKECPGVSQITSLVQLAQGDTEGAKETQKRCFGTVNNVLNGMPVVGHVKGAIHHAVGDHDGGDHALNAASRTTVVVASGAAAALATGGIGAIPAGIAAGACYDIAATEITGKDQGCVAGLKNAVENPSAGAIFDAVAIPVGDGLAGYSGGQLAQKLTNATAQAPKPANQNSVATQAKLNSLEAARAAKLDTLEAGLSGEVGGGSTGGGGAAGGGSAGGGGAAGGGAAGGGGAGGGAAGQGGMTSGQAALRKEINALTSGINIIKGAYEDAINCDSYVNDSWDDLIIQEYYYQQKQNILKLHDQQKPEGKLDLSTVPLFPVKSLEKIHDLNNSNRQPNNPESICEMELNALLECSWLHLKLPEDLFSYTAIVQVYNVFEGLCHSLIRHIDQWRDFISFDQELIGRLSPIMNEIIEANSVTGAGGSFNRPRNSVESARQFQITRQQANAALQNVQNALTNLSINVYKNVKRALLRIQILMHKFIQNNIISYSYIRRYVNVNDFVQLHFKVKTMKGETKVMVVCVSKELYEPLPDIDERPIRKVITIFFKPWYNDALYYDSYVNDSWDDVVVSEFNEEQKQNILKYQAKQEPKDNLNLELVRLFSHESLNEVRASNNRATGQEYFGRLLKCSWLHLCLPKGNDFLYTAFIQLNNNNEGLFYTLIRHFRQFSEFMIFDPTLIYRVPPRLLDLMVVDTTPNEVKHDPREAKKQVRDARMKAEGARNEVVQFLKALPNDFLNDVKKALLRIQILLYDFIEDNINSSKYIGRTVDAEGLEQLHFKVTTSNGETKVMVICVSIELSNPVLEVDQRPIRKVMTVYFKSWEGYEKYFGNVTKDQKEKK